MRSILLPLAFALVATSPASDPIDLIRLGAADLAAATKSPLSVELDDKVATVALVGDRLKITPFTALHVKTREEARALVALAIAYRREPVTNGPRKPGAAEYLLALPFYAAAEDRAQRAHRNTYPLEWNEPSGPDPVAVQSRVRAVGQGRAAFAVHILQKAGGCSGPMVDLLNRMRAEDSSSSAASRMTNAGFARVALADLGRSVYPPDRSCED
jgi:hypothetical protein